MRLTLTLCTLLCAVSILAAPACRASAGAKAPSAGRAALVNGELISAEAFNNELARVERLSLRGKGSAGAATKKQVLESLIVRELLYREALRLGIRVPKAEIAANRALLTKKLSGEAALGTTLDGMGLSTGALEAQMEQGLTIQMFLDRAFSQDAAASDSEVSFYYQDHPDEFKEALSLRFSHILVKVDPPFSPEEKLQARSRVESFRKRLAGGEDFAALAREVSEDSSAKKGGDLGYFRTGQLARKMEDELRGLQPGEVSGVVEDRFGMHLLKLTELRPAGLIPLEKVKQQIQAKLREEKQLKALAPYVKRLRAAAKVEILLNEDEP